MTFLEGLIPLFAIIFTFGIPGILIFFWLYAKHREKMRLIEKGLSSEEAKIYFKDFKVKTTNPFSALKWGILLTFLGAGIAIANILETRYDFDDGITFGIVLLAVGLGSLLYYTILNFKLKSTPNNNSEVQTK
jgi:hypothetical protein